MHQSQPNLQIRPIIPRPGNLKLELPRAGATPKPSIMLAERDECPAVEVRAGEAEGVFEVEDRGGLEAELAGGTEEGRLGVVGGVDDGFAGGVGWVDGRVMVDAVAEFGGEGEESQVGFGFGRVGLVFVDCWGGRVLVLGVVRRWVHLGCDTMGWWCMLGEWLLVGSI